MTAYGYIIFFFLTLLTGLKFIAFLVHHHAAISGGKYEGVGTQLNVGIILTSIFATATMFFHHSAT